MLGRIFKSLSWLGRYWLYCLISGLIAVSLIFGRTHGLNQAIATAPPELVDLEQFSDMVANLESRWEDTYEEHFDRDFARLGTVKQIAERLQEVQAQTNISPAVIWVMPADDFLKLILVTPKKQYVIEKIPGANRERLTKRINELQVAISDRTSLEYYPPARLIYDWIFKPLDPYLEAENIDTLLLCTGPKLRSLPFAALHDGDKFVIEKDLWNIPFRIAVVGKSGSSRGDFTASEDDNVLVQGIKNDVSSLGFFGLAYYEENKQFLK
ncbi:MAG: hypothetical protein RLZZ69_297 [Cyanobacteriota bacterium]